MKRHFIFEEGEWIGNGVVSFTQSPDVLHFRVRWTIRDIGDGSLQCTQVVEIVDGDVMLNIFEIEPKSPSAFSITLENELLGTYTGSGIIDEKMVAWEFREKGSFEGYEVYEKTSEDAMGESYTFRAEYLSSESQRTSIHGKIWKKVEEK